MIKIRTYLKAFIAILLIAVGFYFFIKGMYIPGYIENLSIHSFISATGHADFDPGYGSKKIALKFLLISFSLFTSLGLGSSFSILREDKTSDLIKSLWLISFLLFTLGILWTLRLLLLRPFTGRVPPTESIYLSVSLLLWALSFSLFSIGGYAFPSEILKKIKNLANSFIFR